jgi:hypothetical protein
MLRRIRWPKRQEITGDWRKKIHNRGLQSLYLPYSIVGWLWQETPLGKTRILIRESHAERDFRGVSGRYY